MESEPRLEHRLLDLQTSGSTHQAPPSLAHQCLKDNSVFVTGLSRKRRSISMCSHFLLPRCGNLNPLGRKPACNSQETQRSWQALCSKSPFSNYTPPGSSVSRTSSSSPLQQFWGWSLMHHRWVLAPNSFQMASQSKPPSHSLYFGYPGIVNDAEGPWVLRMAATCSETRTFERPSILEHPP